MLKTPLSACINLMNKYVLQLLARSELKLQVNDLSHFSLIGADLDLVNFCLFLSPYLLVDFLRK